MNIEELVVKHFPFPTFNTDQKETIIKAVEYLSKGVKHVIIEAPTGSGKSAIATTIHQVLRELRGTHRTTIITGTKGLQDQYIASDKKIFDLKGKTNYSCPHGNAPYNSMPCRDLVNSGGCNKSVECPYVTRRTHWCNIADLRLTNASFQIEACAMLVMKPENKANLIIIDECHETPKHLVDHTTLKLNVDEFPNTKQLTGTTFIKSLKLVLQSFSRNKIGSALRGSKIQREYMKNFHMLVNSHMDAFNDQAEKAGADRALGGAIEELQQVADKIELFLQLEEGEWILTSWTAGALELKPVYAFQVANHGIFRKSDQFIHMSATICGIDDYRKSLGIKMSEYKEIRIGNHIPIKNRSIQIINNVKVSGDFDKARLTKNVDYIIKKHGKENGIIHSVSFKLAEEIKDHSVYGDRMLITNKRHDILKALNNHNSSTIIVSPSIEHGYDFKDDMCRWQIIAKVPFLYIGDPFVKLNMDRHPEWYAREAVLRMVQASGRAIRGVDDWAATYILDGNVDRLLRYNRGLFPTWWLDAIL